MCFRGLNNYLKRVPRVPLSGTIRVTIRVLYYRGLNNYLYYVFFFFFLGGVLVMILVYWAPKPCSNY